MKRIMAMALMFGVVFGVGPAGVAAPRQIEDLEKELLSKYRGAGPKMIMKLLGAPNTTSTIKGTDYLVWVAQEFGPGKVGSSECKATFAFEKDELTDIHLAGLKRHDWNLCKRLVDPLLKAPKAPVSPNGGDEKAKPGKGRR